MIVHQRRRRGLGTVSRYGVVSLVFIGILLHVACDSGNPLVPESPKISSGSFSLFLTATPQVITAGSFEGSRISVEVRHPETMEAPRDGQEVVLSTNRGHFGVDPQGNPMDLVRLPLSGGRAQTTLLADVGDEGTAALVASFLDATSSLGLRIVEAGEPPMADFEYVVDGFKVSFANTSSGNPTSSLWDLGDGRRNEEENPMVMYEQPGGTFAVRLTVSNDGGQNTKTQLVTVPNEDPPIALFDYQADGLDVDFMDASLGNVTSWRWFFGDGGSSGLPNPTHRYRRPGNYNVQLTVTSAIGSGTLQEVISVVPGGPLTADFSVSVVGLEASFLDTSIGSPNVWIWDFGDGTSLNGVQNPRHAYGAEGSYVVRLTVQDGNTLDTTQQVVEVGGPPNADFEFEVQCLDVVFTDTSTGNPTTFLWDFGDGARDNRRNPIHTFAAPGIYSVELTASNEVGSSTANRAVNVGGEPEARFDFTEAGRTVHFIDRSTQSPTSYLWQFGYDNQTSQDQNPSHCFPSAAGNNFNVRLTVGNACGDTSISRQIVLPNISPTETCPPGP